MIFHALVEDKLLVGRFVKNLSFYSVDALRLDMAVVGVMHERSDLALRDQKKAGLQEPKENWQLAPQI